MCNLQQVQWDQPLSLPVSFCTNYTWPETQSEFSWWMFMRAKPLGASIAYNILLFFSSSFFYFICFFWIHLYLPFCVCRESVWRVSELGAEGGFVSPASKAWPGCDTDGQHQSQAGLLWSGEPAAGPQWWWVDTQASKSKALLCWSKVASVAIDSVST